MSEELEKDWREGHDQDEKLRKGEKLKQKRVTTEVIVVVTLKRGKTKQLLVEP